MVFSLINSVGSIQVEMLLPTSKSGREDKENMTGDIGETGKIKTLS